MCHVSRLRIAQRREYDVFLQQGVLNRDRLDVAWLFVSVSSPAFELICLGIAAQAQREIA
jgi:hypothetical protein